jgi:transposase-like protein
MGRKYYTSEEKLAAVKLYIKYDFSPSAVIYELGYPSRNRLYSWYKEYKETGKFTIKGNHTKFFEDYLSYIFLKKEESGLNVLVWPNACNDSKITGVIQYTDKQILSEDKKICAIPLVCESKIVGALAIKSTEKEISLKDIEY